MLTVDGVKIGVIGYLTPDTKVRILTDKLTKNSKFFKFCTKKPNFFFFFYQCSIIVVYQIFMENSTGAFYAALSLL